MIFEFYEDHFGYCLLGGLEDYKNKFGEVVWCGLWSPIAWIHYILSYIILECYITFLCLSFHTCKMEINIVLFQSCCEG